MNLSQFRPQHFYKTIDNNAHLVILLNSCPGAVCTWINSIKSFVLARINNDALTFIEGNVNEMAAYISLNTNRLSNSDSNIEFKHPLGWDNIKRGRLYYTIEDINWDDSRLKELLLLLI